MTCERVAPPDHTAAGTPHWLRYRGRLVWFRWTGENWLDAYGMTLLADRMATEDTGWEYVSPTTPDPG